MKLDLRMPQQHQSPPQIDVDAERPLVSGNAIYERSLGINVNLWWGLVLLAFGPMMLALAVRAGRKASPGATAPPPPAGQP